MESFSSSSSSSISSSSSMLAGLVTVDNSYRVLPSMYLSFLAIWCLSSLSWTLNTWRNRNFQVSKLQWMLASVPLIKTLQLALSFSFWYSCTKFQICSLWISFGVYVTGILFQTASIVSFMLISHGYCIMYERLTIAERRKTAALGCILYLTLVGYKAAIPYFTVLLLLNYTLSFYVIFRYISQNLFILREQLNFMEDEDMQTMHDSLRTKYTMFKKFQGAMQIVALVEILVYMNVNESPEGYWLRLLVREWAQFCTFLYIGWTFRTKEASPNISVIPTMKHKWETVVPPIYSMEMGAADFKNLASQAWHVGVPASFPSSHCQSSADPLLVIVQHPHASSRFASEVLLRSKLSAPRPSTVENVAHDNDRV